MHKDCQQSIPPVHEQKGANMLASRHFILLVTLATILTCGLSVSELQAEITPAALPGIVDFELHSPAGIVGGKQTVGWSFTVNCSIQVTSLGFFDIGLDGFGEEHLIGIWNEDQQLLAQAGVSVGQSQPLVGSYRYSNIQPLLLTPGQVYVIGATLSPRDPSLVLMAGDPGPDAFPNLVTNSETIDDCINMVCPARGFYGQDGDFYSDPSDFFAFPGETLDDTYLLAPNFQFVPEPGTAFLLWFGGLGIVRLNRR